jgi:hypothetical protein
MWYVDEEEEVLCVCVFRFLGSFGRNSIRAVL